MWQNWRSAGCSVCYKRVWEVFGSVHRSVMYELSAMNSLMMNSIWSYLDKAFNNDSEAVVIESGHLEREGQKTTSIMLVEQCVVRPSSFCTQLERRDCTISPKALKIMGSHLAHTGTHTDGQNTHCLVNQLSMWSASSSATQSRMHLIPGRVPGCSRSDITFWNKHVSERMSLRTSWIAESL